MEFSEFVNYCFYSLLSGSSCWIAYSITQLNVKIAVVVEKVSNHEHRITKLED